MQDTKKNDVSLELAAVPLSAKHREIQRKEMNINALFDKLLSMRQLPNDAALSRLLFIKPPTISKIRNGKSGISAAVLIRIHEVFDVPIKELRSWMGDHRAYF